MYPISKYKIFTDNKGKVIALSTYAGKTVRGVANCNPADIFDMEKGKQLAIARCAKKIAEKRIARAEKKVREAEDLRESATSRLYKMKVYLADANAEHKDACKQIQDLLNTF